MIYPATEAIQETFISHELKCEIEEQETCSIIRVGITTDTARFEALFISQDDSNDVSMRIFGLVRFAPEKLDAALEAANRCNLDYRFLKLVVNEKSNTVDAEYDFPLEQENIGEAAFEILMRTAHIIEKSYPDIMHSLYG